MGRNVSELEVGRTYNVMSSINLHKWRDIFRGSEAAKRLVTGAIFTVLDKESSGMPGYILKVFAPDGYQRKIRVSPLFVKDILPHLYLLVGPKKTSEIQFEKGKYYSISESTLERYEQLELGCPSIRTFFRNCLSNTGKFLMVDHATKSADSTHLLVCFKDESGKEVVDSMRTVPCILEKFKDTFTEIQDREMEGEGMGMYVRHFEESWKEIFDKTDPTLLDRIRIPVKVFKAGKWYVYEGKDRPCGWNPQGTMDFALYGVPLLCKYGAVSNTETRAVFEGFPRSDYIPYWNWRDGLENWRELKDPERYSVSQIDRTVCKIDIRGVDRRATFLSTKDKDFSSVEGSLVSRRKQIRKNLLRRVGY